MTKATSLTVHLWHAPASEDAPGEVESMCESYLDEDDRHRADQFRRPTTRNQHVIGRGMARRLLADGSVSPSAVRFSVAQGGKPFAAEPADACRPFNVAHTDGLVVCGLVESASRRDDRADRLGESRATGVSKAICLGVDVERLDRRIDLNLADRYFAAPEIEYLDQLPSDIARVESFLRIWTLKESFIKAIGTGLRTPLDQFAFSEIASDRPRIQFLNPSLRDVTGGTGVWQFECLTPRPGFVASVGVEVGLEQRLETKSIEFEGMLARRQG